MKYLFIIYFFTYSIILAQDKQSKEINNTVLFSVNHSFQIPFGELNKRFGNNSDLSITTYFINNNSIIFSVEAGFLFGPTVKDNGIFNGIDGNNGYLISQNGEIPTIRLFERGGHIDFNIGKQFLFKKHKNKSGLVASIGLGYIYHKIFIETLITQLPQINETMLKGYDRLTGGVMTKQFIGYLYQSNLNNIRFLIGIEGIQGFTKDLRGYNYDTQTFINTNRLDCLIGLKCGFIIPIKQREIERYYFF